MVTRIIVGCLNRRFWDLLEHLVFKSVEVALKVIVFVY